MPTTVRVLSNIGFPVLYQLLFSYLLFLGRGGFPASGIVFRVVLGSALVGVPLSMVCHTLFLGKSPHGPAKVLGRRLLITFILPAWQAVMIVMLFD